MTVPRHLRYHREHHWADVESDGVVVIGITEFAQYELGEVVYVGLPSVGDELQANESFAEIESNKTVADVYAPVSGRVLAVNVALESTPTLLNDDPYDAGWLVRVLPSNTTDWLELLSPDDYDHLVAGAGH
jgi:glycine cleavage system H protein